MRHRLILLQRTAVVVATSVAATLAGASASFAEDPAPPSSSAVPTTTSAPPTTTVTTSVPAAPTSTVAPATTTTITAPPVTLTSTTVAAMGPAPVAQQTATEVATEAASAPLTTLTFEAAADARVEASNPATNYGLVSPLRVDSSPAEETFVRFDLAGITGNVTAAHLRFYVTNGTTNGPTVYATSAAWGETTITWDNRPARIGDAADDLGNIAVDTWADFDVTSLVTANGAVSFNLGRTSSDGLFLNSREVADPALRPQLVVTFDDGPPPPTPVTVAADPAGGTYTTSQQVTLTASEPATIRYTTDGSTPTAASAVYAAPLPVTDTTTLSFFATTGDGRTSPVVVEQYVIDPGAPVTTAFDAAADARVEEAHPATNYGAVTTLVADASPQTEIYLRFDVAGLTGPVTAATLRLYVFNETVNGPAAFSAPSTWTESGITWANRPVRATTGLDDKGALPVNAWVDYDITSLVGGNGSVTVALATTSSDGVSFYSRESGNTSLRPQLVVTSEQGTPPVVTANPPGGTFDGPVDVALSASEPATIYYTTDGSTPTTASPVATGPVHIAATTQLRFIGVDANGATSEVVTEDYVVNGDFTPPDTVIDSGPAALVADTSATFTFSATEPGSTFECALDGEAFAPCSSPAVVSGLDPGAHTLAVQATDVALNIDPTPATATWTVDLTPPMVTATSPLDGATDVDVSAVASATLSEALDPASVSATTARLQPSSGGSPVPATVSYDDATATVTIAPASILLSGTAYTATLSGGPGGITDVAGNPLGADVAWSFTTADTSVPVTFTVGPVADAWVDNANPDTNNGTGTSLTVDSSPASISYLQFTLSGITAPVTSAYLRLYASSRSNDGPKVRPAGNGWTESSVTWNNRPATGAAVDDVGVAESRTWIELNVTPLITGNGTFDVALTPDSTDGIDFNSRESSTNRPQLVVTFGGPPPPTVSAAPPGGGYPSPVAVTLTASEPATIHYTTDNSLPTPLSPVYTAPITVAVSETLRFVAITPDGRTSTVESETYSIAVTGYRGASFGSASAPTAKEGQSKLWYTPEGWFSVMFQPSVGDFHIFRLDPATHEWIDTGTLVDARNTTRIDALWDGAKLYTVSAVWGTASSARAEVRRYSYNAGTYTLDAGFPIALNSTGAEVVVIAKAADGKLWVTYTASNKVYVTHSLASDLSWTTPFVIPGSASNVTSDDISSIVAVGDRVGVLWSNQSANAMYYASHVNGAADSVWTVETAYAVPGEESADDHISLTAGSDGRVYAAVKTSLNDVGEPLIHLIVRGASGGWTSHVWGTAENNHTRPIVVLNEEAGRVHVFASAPCCSGGVVYGKTATLGSLTFPGGLGDVVLASESDPNINNVTSTKQQVTAASGLVILAGDDSTDRYLHNELAP